MRCSADVCQGVFKTLADHHLFIHLLFRAQGGTKGGERFGGVVFVMRKPTINDFLNEQTQGPNKPTIAKVGPTMTKGDYNSLPYQQARECL